MKHKFFTPSVLTAFSCSLLALAASFLGAHRLSRPAIAQPSSHNSLVGQLPDPPAAGTYQVQLRHSNKCLHQHGNNQNNGGNVTQWDCIEQDNVKVILEPIQLFEVDGTPQFGPYFFLRFKHSNKCVSLPADAANNGANITQQDCNSNSLGLQWLQIPASDGYVYVVNAATGKCLHQHGNNQNNGGNITQWDCVDQGNVQWKFITPGQAQVEPSNDSSFATEICDRTISLKSWKGDYLHRPDSNQGVTTWSTGVGNQWLVECLDDGKIQFKSWKGDYLHRPDSNQGVTTWSTGIGNHWTLEPGDDGKIQLKSWKGDYLHRPDSNQGVTTWSTGIGNHWTVEILE
ncbi:MAG: RICIN domain-containing protein [Spirulinaceae cyanobacterium]